MKKSRIGFGRGVPLGALGCTCMLSCLCHSGFPFQLVSGDAGRAGLVVDRPPGSLSGRLPQAASASAARRTVMRKVVTGETLECAVTHASPRASLAAAVSSDQRTVSDLVTLKRSPSARSMPRVLSSALAAFMRSSSDFTSASSWPRISASSGFELGPSQVLQHLGGPLVLCRLGLYCLDHEKCQDRVYTSAQ